MPFDPKPIKAILFDYGNTLIEFSKPQITHCDRELGRVLEALYGPYDAARLREIRNADRLAPYSDGYHENDLPAITTNLIRTMFDREPTADELEQLLDVRFTAFVDAITPPDGVHELLERLRRRYKLALVSNYPCGRAIRASLERTKIGPLLEVVVASGDVGRVKPHPLPFETALGQLGLKPADAVYIGDNWLADVQGAKRLGMQAIHINQWDTPEKFDREDGHHDADAVMATLAELESLMGS